MSQKGALLQKRLWQRGALFRVIRDYFFLEEVVEVDTPILSQFGNPDPALCNFVTRYYGPGLHYQQPFYLITSPEYHMKRLLAQGVGSCYYLGKVFRDGELSGRHNPEFTMLEWYRVGYDLEQLMQEVIRLIQILIERSLEVESISYYEAFMTYLEIDPFMATMAELQAILEGHKIDLTFELRDRDEALDLIVSHLIEPRFNPNKLTLLYHYPASQASLSKIVEVDGQLVGKRFELYWQGLELANGYEELTNSQEQRKRFEAENKKRVECGMQAVPIDELLLQSLDQLPFCSGVALGVDRLLMAMKEVKEIDAVIPFGWEEA